MDFFRKLTKKEEAPASPSPATEEATGPSKPVRNILVIDGEARGWEEAFDQVESPHYRLVVRQWAWADISLTTYPKGKIVVDYRRGGSFEPHFVLIRSLVRGLTESKDYRNLLFGLKAAHLPSVNSLESIYMCQERPWVHSELDLLRQRLGDDVFPLIQQNYYPYSNAMLFTPDYPIVVKVGHAEAGYGKVKLNHYDDLRDFAGVLALHRDYSTIESLVANREYDIRVQKIGNHYRCYKRYSANWKGNVGSSHIEDLELLPQYKVWVDECAKLFGGLDILTVDAIHTTDGKDVILEMNDTASGFHTPNEAEDMRHVVELCLEKLHSVFPPESAAAAPSSTA